MFLAGKQSEHFNFKLKSIYIAFLNSIKFSGLKMEIRFDKDY